MMANIDSARTLEELGVETIAAISHFGLTAAASGIVTGSTAASVKRFHFACWPEPLLARYVDEEFMASDPGPRWARGTGYPATWSEIIKRMPAKDPGHHVMQAAYEHGMIEGVCVPMRSSEGAIGLVSMGGNRPAIKAQEFRALVAIATTAFQAGERIDHSSDKAQVSPVLSMREIALLPFLVHGHTDSEIAKLNGISETTVRFHFKNIRRKVGAVSRTHLAAKVVAMGFVTL
jgi:DNA-binding CsgD family transcriptional regulator